MAISSLFALHTRSNTGYAIAPLERLFYEAGLELAGGDAARVHFSYRSLGGGRPATLPPSFTNILEFDFKKAGSSEISRVADYAQRNGISFALFFDIRPLHPVFRPLRQAGVHTILTYSGAPLSSRMPLWKLTLKRLKFALSRSKVDGVISESQAMADLAIYGRGLPKRMVDIVPVGVDIKLFCPAQTEYVYQVMGLPRERKVVIYAGHMEPRKGVRILIEAAIELLVQRKRSDVCFLIFGNKGDESKPFEEMYANMGIDKLIRFGGYRPDLAKIYPGCFCGVIPSTGWDSFTYSSVEEAACGLPVVASRLQGLRDAVLDGVTGLLYEPGNSTELANCLEKLLDNPMLARQYGCEGRARCERELNLESQRERFVRILRARFKQQ